MHKKSQVEKSGATDPEKYLRMIILLFVLLYFGRSLFIPLFYGLFIAVVMYPICKWLESAGFNRTLAIIVCLSIVGVLLLCLLLLLGWQLSLFRQDIPELTLKARPFLSGIQEWLVSHLSFSLNAQSQWLRQSANSFLGNAGHWLQLTLNATATTLFSLFIIPIYTALFLYHRGVFVRFLRKTVGVAYLREFNVVLDEAIHTYFSYIKGMIMVYIIVGILNSIGLLALGVKHAILFGMLTAIMTIIPYVGIIVSAMLPVTISFIYTDSIWYPIGVIGVFSFVQYLEANVIFPKVVGQQLNVSTWAMLIAIIAGGIIWGVSGMVLFIPMVAILKIVSDHVKELEAINILLNRNSVEQN